MDRDSSGWWAERRAGYKAKNDLIFERAADWQWIAPRDFYRTIFPEGFLERKGEMVDWDEPGGGKPNAIVIQITNRKRRVVTKSGRASERREVERYTVTDDLDMIEERFLDSLDKNEPCFIAPVSYFGKSRSARNARFLHAFAIDLDGVEPQQMANILKQIRNGHDPARPLWTSLPQPTFIVNSGTGIHLYFVLDRPIPLVPRIVPFLQAVKESLTDYVWRDTTTTLDAVQHQGIFQAFRMVGSTTKLNGSARDSKRSCKYEAVAFAHMGPDGRPWRCTIDYLLDYAGFKRGDKGREELAEIMETAGRTPIDRAREMWPDWYRRRVVEGAPAGRWAAKRDLYDWWKRQIIAGAKDEHRYWCLNVLAAYADKCEVPYDELERDALDLVPHMESLTERPDNHFTEEDALAAISSYGDGVIHKLTIDRIERRSAIQIPRNKRNGQKQSDHLEEARAIRDIRQRRKGSNWWDGGGRPKGSGTKRDAIRAYAAEHPEASQREIATALGVSKTTVNKWLKPGWREEWERQKERDAAMLSLRRVDGDRWEVLRAEGHPEVEGRVLDLSDRQARRIPEGPKDWLVGKPQEPIS